MILLRGGTWASYAGKFLIWERLYKYKWKWTPFCRVRLRHYKTIHEANHSDQHLEVILHNETIKQSLDDVAHEIWTTAQLLPGEGIVDGVDRIVEVLKKQFLFIIGNKD